MCGIAGIIGPPAPWLEDSLSRMVRVQRHRGPDSEGIQWLKRAETQVGFGYRRLAIRDLSGAGAQPMTDKKSGNVLIFNGEIYNSPDLARELETQGVRFRGHSDTEVLLQALVHWGVECIPRLHGMYAFAWFNPGDKSVVLARDPLGIKPLFVSTVGKHLLFASEVRSLMASRRIETDLSTAGIASYLAYGSAQAPWTIFDRIRAFPAGKWQRIHLSGDKGWNAEAPKTHWFFPKPNTAMRIQEAVDGLREGLTAAVSSHLISDVPVGMFLSSGMDSTLVAALAARKQALTAFTVGFADEPDHSEADAAAVTAQRLGIRHKTLSLLRSDALTAVQPWLQSQDHPSMDGLNTFIISRMVREEGVVVALSGQGGDELFGGYPSFRDVPRLLRYLRWIAGLPGGARAALAGPLAIGRSSAFREKLEDMLRVGPDLMPLTLQRRRAFSDRQIRSLLKGSKDVADAYPHLIDPGELVDLPLSLTDPVHAISVLESRFYLGNTLLPVGDATGMAHSLEIRVPMLDRPLLDFAFSIPGRLRLSSSNADKSLLRRAFRDILPSDTAVPKRGFVIPVKRWMDGPLRPICEGALDVLKHHPLFDGDAIDRMWSLFLREPESPIWSRIWTLVALGSYLGQIRDVAGATNELSDGLSHVA